LLCMLLVLAPDVALSARADGVRIALGFTLDALPV